MLVAPGPGSRHQLAALPGSLFLRELRSEVLAKIDFVKKIADTANAIRDVRTNDPV
jgi:hypothetical protein